jgi:hypothetical protein
MANEHFSFLDASLRPDYPFACIVPFFAAMRKFQLSKQAGWQPNAAGLDRRRSFCLLLCFQRGKLYVYTAIIKQYIINLPFFKNSLQHFAEQRKASELGSL